MYHHSNNRKVSWSTHSPMFTLEGPKHGELVMEMLLNTIQAIIYSYFKLRRMNRSHNNVILRFQRGKDKWHFQSNIMASVYLMIHSTEPANICQESDILRRKLVKLMIVRVCNLTFETSLLQKGIFILINTHTHV